MALVTVLLLGTFSGGTPWRWRRRRRHNRRPRVRPEEVRGEEEEPAPREVWAAQPTPETLYAPPNRLIWRLSEIVASHKGQPSWHQAVVKTRNFEAEFIQMAPGEKTKTQFYSDDRAFWVVESGQSASPWLVRSRLSPPGFFPVQAAPSMDYSMETVGDVPRAPF